MDLKFRKHPPIVGRTQYNSLGLFSTAADGWFVSNSTNQATNNQPIIAQYLVTRLSSTNQNTEPVSRDQQPTNERTERTEADLGWNLRISTPGCLCVMCVDVVRRPNQN